MPRATYQRGVDLRVDRLLFARLRALGLDSVGAEARQLTLSGRSVGASLIRSNFDQLRATMIGGGPITAREFEHDIKRLDDPYLQTPLPPLWARLGTPAVKARPAWHKSTWGRKSVAVMQAVLPAVSWLNGLT